MLKRPNILVLGSFVMDLTATTKRVPNAGESVIGMKFTTAPGGKGANQAVQCAKLGAHVTMVGRVWADAFGTIMMETAAAAGVDVSRVITDERVPSGTALILVEVNEEGVQNRITICPGANSAMTVEDIAWLKEEIGDYDMLMMQFELPMEVVETAAKWARAAGVPVMVNPAPAAPIPATLLTYTDYLSPNESEAASISNHPLRVGPDGVDKDDVVAAAEIFREKGVKHLIITLGENGSVITGEDGLHFIPCVKMERVVDPTAAGDSFVASFCTGVCAGLPQREALALASHASAIAVSRMGAMPSLPTISEVQALMIERNYRGFDPKELDALKRIRGEL